MCVVLQFSVATRIECKSHSWNTHSQIDRHWLMIDVYPDVLIG